MIRCSRCGHANPENAKFCSHCGSALGAAEPPAETRQERKVVSISFADLVGFTSRAEDLDPEDVHKLLAGYHARVKAELERFGGVVEKFIGDAVMALFGATRVHEDDPERAVRAALAIREWAKAEPDLDVRIGITTGEALVSLGARPEAGEGMASGDVVNTAARIQAAAPVGGILVDETTYRATNRVIRYADADPVEAKGKSELIRVWEARDARARVHVERMGGAALTGRARELDLLRDAFARAQAEREPQLVTLVGVPGIGKSRLVYELFKHVERGSELVYWRHGRSLPYGEGVSFWAFGEIVKAQAGILESDDTEEADAKLRRALESVALDANEARWVLGHLRPLVGLETESELRGDRRDEAYAAWRRFIEALAENRALVAVFEDLHWADDGLLDFVDHLADWVSGVPLLLLCTARPELLTRRPGWSGGKSNALTVSLSPLSDQDTARLLHELLPRPVIDAELEGELVARAGGNPLYAEEFTRLVEERGAAYAGATSLPETVQGLIAARLDTLDVDQKSLIQDASVVGRTFWVGSVAAIGERDARTTERLLHAVERREFVRRERQSSVAGEVEYAFRHVLVRDVAYSQIPRGARARKHTMAAEWIGSIAPDRADDRAEMLAHHYLNALELARAAREPLESLAEPARRALRDAGDRAFALNAFESASGFYAAALELWPVADLDRPLLLYRYGSAESIAHDRGEELLGEALDGLIAVGDKETAAEAALALVYVRWRQGDTAGAERYVERAASLLEGAPPSRAKAWVLSHMSRLRMLADDRDEAVRVGSEALAMAEELRLEEVQAHALNNIGTAKSLKGGSDGEADLRRSIDISLRLNSPEAARAYNNLAVMAAADGDLRRFSAIRREGRRVCARTGASTFLRFMELQEIGEAYADGDWARSLGVAQELISAAEAGTPHYLAGSAYETRGYIRLARSDPLGAQADAAKCLALGRAARDPQALRPALGFAAFAHASAGALDIASEHADELLATGLDLIPHHVSPQFGLAWALVALGREADLLDRAEPLERNRWIEAAIAICSGELVAAADLYDEIGALPNEAYTRLRAAQAGVVGAQLDKAIEFFRRAGAIAYLHDAESLLSASA